MIFFSLQTKNTELDKIKRELEEVKKDKLSLEEAKSWLERRLKETEVHGQGLYCKIINIHGGYKLTSFKELGVIIHYKWKKNL